MNKNICKVQLAGAGALCIAQGFMSTAAYAQPADEPSAVLQEVTITAQRREESAQRASVAIQVVGAEQLSAGGVTQATDLSNVVPGLTVSLGGTSVQTYLRGVGSFATDASAESSVAYNINGVYISRPPGIGPIFFDLARVEVLKGPQGTLYGRNASGGAINVITNRPSQEFGGSLSVEGGNDSYRQVTGVLNVPVSSTFAFRAAGQVADRDGFLTDGYNDQKTRAARLLGLWNPSDDVSLLVTGEYAHIGGQGDGAVRRSTLRPLPSDPWTGPSEPGSQPPTAFIPGGTKILADGLADNDIRALSAELNWKLPFATLTFIPAARKLDLDNITYPGFRFVTHETSEQHSGELRLGDTTKRLNWVAGAYYFDEDQTERYHLNANPIQESIVDIGLHNKSWAVFGQTTFSVTEALRLIGGVRYTDEKKDQTGFTTAVLPVPGTANNAGSRSFNDVNWKAGLEYDVAPDSMLFVTLATGFKAGGFFPSVPAPDNSYDPEKLRAFTFGSRNRFADNRLQLNGEAFYWKYDDKQERYLGATPSGTTGLLTTNAGSATLYGGNIDIQFAATTADRLRFGVEYLHSRYDDFKYTAYNPTGGSYPVQASGCVLGAASPLTLTPNPIDTQQTVDCSGKQLVKAPEWSGSAGYEHTFGLASGQLVAGVNATFATREYLTTDFIKSAQDNGYALVNADLTYHAPNDRWSIGAWGRNLTNEAVYSGGFRYPFSRAVAAGGDPTLGYMNIRPPRTYGLRASYGF